MEAFFPMFFPLFVLAVVVFGFVFVKEHQWSTFVAISMIVGGFIFIAPSLIGGVGGETTQTRPEQTVPAPPTELISDNDLMNLLILIGAIVGSALIAFVVISWWNSGKEIRKTRAVEAENKRKSLQEAAALAAERLEEKRKTWKNILAQGDEYLDKWVRVSTDLNFILQFPMIANSSEPVIKESIALVTQYRMMRTESVPTAQDNMWGTELGQLVRKMKVTLDSAIVQVRKTKASQYSFAERKKLRQAKNLFDISMNTAASANERQIAYKRLRDIMDDLHISVSDDLEERLAIGMRDIKAIEAGKDTHVITVNIESRVKNDIHA